MTIKVEYTSENFSFRKLGTLKKTFFFTDGFFSKLAHEFLWLRNPCLPILRKIGSWEGVALSPQPLLDKGFGTEKSRQAHFRGAQNLDPSLSFEIFFSKIIDEQMCSFMFQSFELVRLFDLSGEPSEVGPDFAKNSKSNPRFKCPFSFNHKMYRIY